MAFPIKELLDYDDNVYTLACATMRRAMQLAKIEQMYDSYKEYVTIELEQDRDKPLTVALKEVLSENVQFRLD